MDKPKKGYYRHFKGGRYELIDFAKHSETQEEMVVYRALYGEFGLWVRPLSMWSEKVERGGRVYTRFLPEEEYLALQAEEEQIPPPPDGECPPPPEDDFIPPPEADFAPPPEAFDDAPRIPEKQSGSKEELLAGVFGYESFRAGQAQVIDSILSGQDTLAVLPTGAGKSVCYQIPALMLDGITVVISPLISLMKDQVTALNQNGVPCAYLNSSLSEGQMNKALARLRKGAYRIVYVAPERLNTPRFLSIMQETRVAMVAVDEAHCISQWGQDFRPSYLEIPQFISTLAQRPRVCAFTATATERVRDDIAKLLNMRRPKVIVTGFARENLYLSVTHTHEKDAELLTLLERYPDQSGIIYCATRKTVEEVCERLRARGIPATRYHAGLSDEERSRNQEDFIYDRAPVIVATNAFGMGIDKSNVRFVIHYNMPKDIESYYQEAGRAGRDGVRADCHLLFEPRDIVLQEFFIGRMGEDGALTGEALKNVQDAATKRLRAMAAYAQTTKCLRSEILRYFGEEGTEKCGFCSNCTNPRPASDVTEAAVHIVRCVRLTGGRFGSMAIIDTLRGSRAEKITSRGLNRNAEYAALKDMSVDNLKFIIEALCEMNALTVSAGDYPLLQCSKEADSVLSGERAVFAYQAKSKAKGKAKTKPAETAADRSLFEDLRQLRLKLAKEKNIAPYMIFGDRTLADMCEKQPSNMKEMAEVSGVGAFKLQLYGEIFLREIRAHRDQS